MDRKFLRIILVATWASVSCVAATAQNTNGAAPGSSGPSPSVDTGPTNRSGEQIRVPNPDTTGSTTNPPGNPPGTIDAGPKAGIDAGVSGKNPCYPGQTGQAVGSTNPSGMPSQCH